MQKDMDAKSRILKWGTSLAGMLSQVSASNLHSEWDAGPTQGGSPSPRPSPRGRGS